jgi:hypothetical protein
MKRIIFVLSFCLLFAFSCSTEKTLQEILSSTAEAPVFLGSHPASPTEIVFNFSKPVQVILFHLDPDPGFDYHDSSKFEGGETVKVTLPQPLEAGKRFTVDILVQDSAQNTLNVITPFMARNDRMPAMVFNELRLDNNNPRVEFIEFIALKAGNLGALRLFIAHQSLTTPVYEFPSVEVKAGEYIVLHLRTVEEGCVDELGSDLSLSAGRDSHPNARDLWIPGNRKIIHTPNGFWLLDQDDKIIDALLVSENPVTDANNRTFIAAAEFLGLNNAWLPPSGDRPYPGWIPGPADAASTRGTTNTRTLCRDQSIPPDRRSVNWYVTVTSGNTPGFENNPRRHN